MSIDLNTDAGLLQCLASEVRGKTLKLLDDVNEGELMWSPSGLSNHILWHAGHVLWVQDYLCIEAVTGKGELPGGWAETFGKFCRPVRETKQWPAVAEIRDRLDAQLPRLLEVIGGLTAAELEGPPRCDALGTDRPLWYFVTHASHDEANHQGQMYLLMKTQRAK